MRKQLVIVYKLLLLIFISIQKLKPNEMAIAIVIGIIIFVIILITTLVIVFSGGNEDKQILDNICAKQAKTIDEFLIGNNLNNLSLNDNYTDIELIAQSVVFRAHKLILAAHSKYLATKLQTYSHGLNFTDPNSIFQLEMSFVDHSTLSIILEFIYGKSIPLAVFENESDYSNLLKASEEFQLKGLKCEISKQLSKKLNNKNVANVIVLAEETDTPFLMNVASKYLLDHLNDIRLTHEWKVSAKINGHILANAIDFHGKLSPNTTCNIECYPVNFQSKSIVNNLRRFFTTNYLADARIRVVTEQHDEEQYIFHVNKAILISQSLKFRHLFANSSNIQIDGVDNFVMREFLQYMYCGSIVSLEKYAAQLLVLSSDYGMDILRDKCEDVIIDQLSISNAANIVEIANSVESQRLSKAVLDFILKNRNAVAKTPGWSELKKNKPELLNKIFSHI